MRAVIYARYSSDNQREESIDGQLRECKKFAEYNGITVIGEYIDRAFSAKTDNRPEFQRMIKDSYKSVFDTVIVWKLDRFARTVVEGTALAQELYERNITLNILNMGSIEHTPIGTLLLNVMLSFAQFEKEMINSRCQAGREYAREHNPNYKEGRPKKFNRDQINLALDLLSQGKTYKQVESMTGISKSTIIRAKRHTTFDTD